MFEPFFGIIATKKNDSLTVHVIFMRIALALILRVLERSLNFEIKSRFGP